MLDQRQRVGRQIAMREHGALRAPGRARRVDDCRKIVGTRYDRVEDLRRISGSIEELPALRIEGQHDRRARERRHQAEGLRPANNYARRCIGEEVRELRLLIADVEGEVDEACTKAREIERQCVPMLVDLRRDPIHGRFSPTTLPTRRNGRRGPSGSGHRAR